MIEVKHTKVEKDPVIENTLDMEFLATSKNGLYSANFGAEYNTKKNELTLMDIDTLNRYSFNEDGEYNPDMIEKLSKVLHSSEAAIKTMIDEVFILMINY